MIIFQHFVFNKHYADRRDLQKNFHHFVFYEHYIKRRSFERKKKNHVYNDFDNNEKSRIRIM